MYEHAFSAATHIIWELDYRRKREETLLPSDYIYQYEILFIDNYTLDLEASGNYIYFRNNDRPGIVGKVATLLGENNINIANFGLARVGSKGSEAISFVLVDDKVTSEVVKKIADLDDIIEAKYIRI